MDWMRLLSDPQAAKSMDPDKIQIDEMEFSANFSANGTIGDADQITIDPNFYAFLLGVSGWIEEPGTAVSNHVNILWNITLDGKGQPEVFMTDQALARLVNIDGSHKPIEYPGGAFRFAPGRQVNVQFSQRSGTTWQGAAGKRVGIVLTVLLVHMSLIDA